MTGRVTMSRHGDVAVVAVTAAAGTGLVPALRRGLAEHLRAAERDARVRRIVLLAEGGALAGDGDGDPLAVPSAAALAAQVEACRKPVFGALDGLALDAGLEVFLACRLRTGSPRCGLGFPAAAAGRMPRAGGTQRLPRLVGVAAALDLLGSGRLVEAEAAVALGLLDTVAQDPLVGSALSAARRLADADLPPPVARRMPAGEPPAGTDPLARAVAASFRPLAEGSAVEAALAAAADSLQLTETPTDGQQ
ncbi:enoyl-CoA hydratase/isomerase family protein [Caenispirillum bisanense]|uniref:3-hydroxyacyl-CoA dehydrogenase n=1 Tax=Caenispirillum bisanense TaxID=414052 RepID=A0A286G2Y3_9PROT|nr:enoyl-CoA hydratase/isomerase family protein [Caenispirillum bisanense]SOD89881.1 3-hydroxyacyl-CoA dehydrogenase [Caenispirillum bisanense]